MASSSHSSAPLAPAPTTFAVAGETKAIDTSTRAVVSLFVSFAAVWLLGSGVFGLITAFKLHSPGFLADCEWFTYGRTASAKGALFVYGWGFNAAFALSLWLIARLSRAVLQGATLLMIAGLFWNLGVLVSLYGILTGSGTSLPLFEIPGFAAPLLFFAYVLIGVWGVVTFKTGRSSEVFISQWYVLAALFWFPWLFSLAAIMLFLDPARGTVQTLVHTWYSSGLMNLWFAPIGLGAVYYFLPKLLGRPISNYYLSVYGFWTLAIFGAWSGLAQLVGGPVPAWVISAGVAATLMMIVPYSVLFINFFGTLFGGAGPKIEATSLRFIAIGVVAFAVGAVATVLTSLRDVAEVTQFTFLGVAQSELSLYGFFSLVAFGGFYYLLPRVTGAVWPSSGLIGFHFLASVGGVILGVGSLAVGGLVQGGALHTLPSGPDSTPVPVLEIVQRISPYLFGHTLATVILIAGHLAFAVNVIWLLIRGAQNAAVTESVSLEAAAR